MPKLFFTLALLLLLNVAGAAPAGLDRTDESITALHAQHFLSDPDYWRQNAIAEGKCDGGKVATMLVEVAQVFNPVATVGNAIDLLKQRGVIGSPDVWKKTAVFGNTASGTNVATVLNRCAARLPIEAPRSAKAPPLEATRFAQIKVSYDVVIAGAGTGGVGAAVQAARMGRSVLLLEETDWIGGQMNAAAVTSMDEGVTLVRERGLYRELCGLIAAHYQPLGINYTTAYWNGHVCVEPRIGRTLLHRLLGDARGSGVLDLVLRTRVAKVHRNGNSVTGVEIESGGQSRQVTSKILIDATEWGDLIPLTGARYRAGNCTSDAIDPTRRVQDNTWTAVVKQYPQGVPDELLIKQPPPGYSEKVAVAFARSLTDGDQVDMKTKPWNWATFIGYRGMPDSSRQGDSPPITRTHLNYNNDYHSSVAEIEDPAARLATNREMRLKTLHLLYYLQHTLGKSDWSVANDEGFDSAYNQEEIDRWLADRPDLQPYRPLLIHFSIIPYTRESRRIIGLHTLTAREIERKNGKPIQFAHTVALGDYPVDLHGSMTAPYLELDLDREADIPDKFGGKGIGPFSIPFECFIPEKIDGFLPAEKNFSQSRLANGATRLQPHTLLMGQAVGAIAALAVEKQVLPRSLNPEFVQRALIDAGATLGIEPIKDVRWGTPEWKARQLDILRHGVPLSDSGARYEVDPHWPALPVGTSLGLCAGIGVDSHGRVFVFHRNERAWSNPFPTEPITDPTVAILDGQTGKLLESWGAGQFIMPHGLSLDREDNVWLTDVGLHQVFKFSPDGHLLLTLGERGKPGADQAHFNLPTDIAVLPDGSFYVSDGYRNTRVVKFDAAGRYQFEWGGKGTGPGEFNLPHGVAVDSHGRVFVCDRSNSRLQVFDPTGKFLAEWKGTEVGRPYGVAISSNDHVFAIDGGTRARALEFDPAGNIVATFGGPGDRPGEFQLGHDLAVAPDGSVYVAEGQGKRVQKFIRKSL